MLTFPSILWKRCQQYHNLFHISLLNELSEKEKIKTNWHFSFDSLETLCFQLSLLYKLSKKEKR